MVLLGELGCSPLSGSPPGHSAEERWPLRLNNLSHIVGQLLVTERGSCFAAASHHARDDTMGQATATPHGREISCMRGVMSWDIAHEVPPAKPIISAGSKQTCNGTMLGSRSQPMGL